MEIKQILTEYSNSSGTKHYNNHSFISSGDLDILKTWYESNIISFKGFNGKVFFSPLTTFPRYKFTEYSRNNNQIVKRVRDLANSDIVVIDTNKFSKSFNIGSPKIFQKITDSCTDTDPKYLGLPVYITVSTISAYCEEGYNLNMYSAFEELKFLVHLYNNKNSIKLVSVSEVNTEINKQYQTINSVLARSLNLLLGSDDVANVKLGMEMITNVDIEASLLHLMILSSTNNIRIRDNDYYSSTNFKSFRNKLCELSKKVDFKYFNGESIINNIKEFLSMDNKFIQEEDVDYCYKLIEEELREQFKLEEDGFVLDKFTIKLNIDPNKIIKKHIDVVENNQYILETEEEKIVTSDIAENFIITE